MKHAPLLAAATLFLLVIAAGPTFAAGPVLRVIQGDTARFAAEFIDAEGNSTVTFTTAGANGQPVGAVEKEDETGTFQWLYDTAGAQPGSQTVTITATDSAGASSQFSFGLEIESISPAQNWRRLHFGGTTDQGDAADSADPDRDGLSNLLEFAFGLDPKTASERNSTRAGKGSGIGAADGANALRAIFTRRKDYEAAGLVYTVEFTTDLKTWQPSTAVPTLESEHADLQQVSVPFPSQTDADRFCFFRVTVKRG